MPCLPRFRPTKNFGNLQSDFSVWDDDDLESLFEAKRLDFNNKLDKWVKHHDQMDVLYVQGLRADMHEKLRDGIHLSDESTLTFIKLLKRELIFHRDKSIGGERGKGRKRNKKRGGLKNKKRKLLKMLQC